MFGTFSFKYSIKWPTMHLKTCTLRIYVYIMSVCVQLAVACHG